MKQVVDVVETSAMKQELDEAIKQLQVHGIPDPYVLKLEEFKEISLWRNLSSDEQGKIKLVPTHSYQLILNSGTKTPAELAEEFEKFVHENHQKDTTSSTTAAVASESFWAGCWFFDADDMHNDRRSHCYIGRSSSCKSSIQREFQVNSMPHLWEKVGIDNLFDKVMPDITPENSWALY